MAARNEIRAIYDEMKMTGDVEHGGMIYYNKCI
jgi:hypothetical protein